MIYLYIKNEKLYINKNKQGLPDIAKLYSENLNFLHKTENSKKSGILTIIS